MTPTLNLICSIAALIVIAVMFFIAHHLYRENQRLRVVSCSGARMLDHLAAFINVVKLHSQDVKNDPDIKKLALETLVHAENHRMLRSKNSPQTDLLIRDLSEWADQRATRNNHYASWEAQSVGQQ